MFRQIAQDPHDFNQARPPAREDEGAEPRRPRGPPGQDELDRQLGRRLYKCQKLVTELQSVECCLLWFRDELPPALLLQNAPGLLGLPQQQLPAGQATYHRGIPQGPSPPSAADLHDAKEYLQAANTRERFMRLWHEQAYSAHNIHVPRKVARAKASCPSLRTHGSHFQTEKVHWLQRKNSL